VAAAVALAAAPARSAQSSRSASSQFEISSPPRSRHLRNARIEISSVLGPAGAIAIGFASVIRDLCVARFELGDAAVDLVVVRFALGGVAPLPPVRIR